MAKQTRLLLIVLVTLVPTSLTWAQPPVSPPDVVIQAPQPSTAPAPLSVAPLPPAPYPTAPLPPAPYPTAPLPPAPAPAPYPVPAPVFGPAPPALPPPGIPLFPANPTPSIIDGVYFIGGDLEILKPHVTNGLEANLPLNGKTVQVDAPAQNLSWTLSPLLCLGVRLPQNAGELTVDYRFIATDGVGSAVGTDGTVYDLKSRLNLNQFDVNYDSCRAELTPYWDFQWRLGVRLVTAFYDSEATSTLQQNHVSNYFLGAGPQGGFEIQRHFGPLGYIPAFSLFGRMDGAVMVGQIDQKFSELVAGTGTGIEVRGTQSVPVLRFQTGLHFSPPGTENYLHFTLGYEYERWWSLGRLDSDRLDLTTQGFFLGGQFDF